MALQSGNGEQDPLRTVVVNFKGAVQKIFITALQFESDANAFWGALLMSQRLLLAREACDLSRF